MDTWLTGSRNHLSARTFSKPVRLDLSWSEHDATMPTGVRAEKIQNIILWF